MLLDATEAAAANLSQHRIFTGKIPEKCWLADFQNLHNVFDSGVFVPARTEQANGRVDNLLPQSGLLALAEANRLCGYRFIQAR
jgi:hypothetical protein